MAIVNNFLDSVTSLFNNLANRRQALTQNIVTSDKLNYEQLNAIYRTGLGSKIVRLKIGHALKNTLSFSSKEDETYYNEFLAGLVKDAAKWQLVFGRGIIVILEPRAQLDMAEPLPADVDPKRCRFLVFSGDMVFVRPPSIDLNDPEYQKVIFYQVRNATIHHSRVVDFRYVQPKELDRPAYFYGGIPEFELIRPQIINDGVVERAIAGILEKNSTLYYKVKGFKEAMMSKQAAAMVEYFQLIEDRRSIYGAALLDQEDDAVALNQTLTNLSEADQVTLRRIAMVTGIPMAYLVGENVKGLNSTGENERLAFQEMIEALQSDYLVGPINELMKKLGQGVVKFKENQGDTPLSRVEYEGKVIANAAALSAMGEDHVAYLEEKGVATKAAVSVDDLFEEADDENAEGAAAGAAAGDGEAEPTLADMLKTGGQ